MPAATAPVVSMSGVRKRFNEGLPNETEVLHGIDLAVRPGEFAALIGPSGSGKSTLLNLIGLLDRPSAGEYLLKGVSIGSASDDERTRARLDTLGFVFQFHHLLPGFSALENVMLPGLMRDGAFTRSQREMRASCSPRSGCPAPSTSGPVSCQAACSSGLRSPAHWRSRPTWCS
jgi:lipoprotein-releasing system ATP-binding protein